jgi:hypothetical protein
MDSEKELLDAFDRVVHEDFPNPQRIACPGREVLLKLAQLGEGWLVWTLIVCPYSRNVNMKHC